VTSTSILRQTPGRRSLTGKREPPAHYAAQLHAVWFTADELEVVRGGPDARRSLSIGAPSPFIPRMLKRWGVITK